jgi:AbrB family looped-hinge helix DNA binding protein
MTRKGVSNLECCGFSKVHKSGQMTIPAEARKAVDFETGTALMVFADRATRRLVVTIKPLDEELLDLASRSQGPLQKSV